jgi:hypothetical protein
MMHEGHEGCAERGTWVPIGALKSVVVRFCHRMRQNGAMGAPVISQAVELP